MGRKKYSNEEEKKIVEEYISGVGVEQLKEKYGFKTRKSITDKIKKFYPDDYEEIIKDKRILKKGYTYSFEKIENCFNAYFLGLLLTDGYVIKNTCEIGIDLSDEDCIKFLSDTIGKDYKTYPVPENGKAKKDRHRLILSLPGEKGNMERLGLVPNKTLTLQPPKLTKNEEKYLPYIIRGLIDGDGSIYANGYGAPTIAFVCASLDFITWVKNVLENKLFLKDITIHKHQDREFYELKTSNQENILKILILVYDKPFGMSRKYKKLRKMFRDYNKDNLLVMTD